MAKKGKTVRPPAPAGWTRPLPPVLALAFILTVCLLLPSAVKPVCMVLLLLTLALSFLRFPVLRGRVTPALLALLLIVALDGFSMFYAVSGKFALDEFLKICAAFCLTVCLLAAAPARAPGRWIASVLSGAAALSGLVSIDLISTRMISGAFLKLIARAAPEYESLAGLEAGVRMTSLFANPNIFAGIAGLGVLLALGLALSARTEGERRVHLCCLSVSSLAFLLAFSMGASAMIALAFLVYLMMERRERRPALFALMVETLALTLVSSALISLTSFDVWTGPRPIPLLCAVLGAAALCALDQFLGRRLAVRLARRGRGTLFAAAVAVALLGVFLLFACNLTGAAELPAGGILRRAAYPEPGDYTLSVQSSGPLNVTIESQNQQETMMHTSTILYSGPAADASFAVPEGSLVTYYNFYADSAVRLEAAEYKGTENGAVPLGYPLLPGFIANRLQGLFANQNAIQRFVFFSDGLKLFRQNPILGRGLGGFENGLKSVQPFYYETKYAHNHYIQALVETGVVGLLLFLGLLAVSALSLWRARGREAAPALAAALVFMAGHAAVEVVFSAYAYLPFAFGVFALIGLVCEETALPERAAKPVQCGAVAGACVLLAVFAFLLNGNLRAAALVENVSTMESFSRAVALDRFEWADYALSYTLNSLDGDEAVRAQADAYAERLSELDSNTIPLYLSEYYFATGRMEEGLRMAEKYVLYTGSDERAWRGVFDLLAAYEEDSEAYRTGVLRIAERLDEWKRENLGQIQLSEENEAFLSRLREDMG